MMTKTHFVKFANAIKSLPTFADKIGIASLVIEIAESDNPRFDRDRFMRACGIDPDKQDVGEIAARGRNLNHTIKTRDH